MSLTLIIEDGTGKVDSNTYIDVTEFRDYFTCQGVDTTGLTDNNVTAGLINAATNLLEYCYEYKGELTFPDTPQALSWPRKDMIDYRGCEVAETQIPGELKKAQAELARSSALKIQESSRINFEDNPDVTGAVKRSKLDVLEEEYFGPGTNPSTTAEQTVLDYVFKLLESFLVAGSGSKFMITNKAVT